MDEVLMMLMEQLMSRQTQPEPNPIGAEDDQTLFSLINALANSQVRVGGSTGLDDRMADLLMGMEIPEPSVEQDISFFKPERIEELESLAALFQPRQNFGSLTEQPDATRVVEDLFVERLITDQFLRSMSKQEN